MNADVPSPRRGYDECVELRHLRTFVSVAEECHFGRAAERLFLSPPAVTAHIHQLERDLGVRLLTRTPVSLTAAGAALLEHARRTIREADATLAAASSYRPGSQAGSLRVGILSNGAGELTPAILQSFMVSHPGVQVSLHGLTFTDHLPALLERRVDVAFLRPAPDDPDLEVTPLTTDPRVAVLPARHRLADAPELPAEAVLDEAFVRVAEEAPRSFHDYLYLAGLRNGEPTRHAPDVVHDVGDVLAAVAAGRGVASAVSSFARSHPWPGVRQVPLMDTPPALNTLVHLRTRSDPVVEDFRQVATRIAGSWHGGPAPTRVHLAGP